MNFDALVAEIVSRVAQKVEQAESAAHPRPKLLVLTREHGECCHRILESSWVQAVYDTACALLCGETCDVSEYDALALFGLNNESLSKLAAGICDTTYTSLAMRAILSGKKIYAVRDEVELFDYEKTAPAAYYAMMLEKVAFLEKSGVCFCPLSLLEETIAGTCCQKAPQASAAARSVCEVCLAKKVITERDVKNAQTQGATVIAVAAKSLLTDLAKEYAHGHGIAIVRKAK